MDNFILKEQKFAGFWKRFQAAYIDFLILLPFYFTYRLIDNYLLFTLRIPYFSILWHIVLMLAFFLYDPFFLSRYGKTPGKMIAKIKVTDKTGNIISFARALLRKIIYLPSLVSGIYASLIIYNQVMLNNPAVVNYMSSQRWLLKNHSLSVDLVFIFLFMGIVDILIILRNYRKRAGHDYIANTYVTEEPVIDTKQHKL